MTDPADLQPISIDLGGAPPPDAADLRGSEWDRHREVLGLLLVLAAVGQVLQALLTGYGYAKPSPGSGEGINWSTFLTVLGTGGSITSALLVASALVVAGGSGRREPGRLGWATVQAVSVVGVVVAALSLLSIEEYHRQRSDAPSGVPVGFGAGVAYGWMEAAMISHMLPSAALAGGAAYLAWRRLRVGGSYAAEIA